jgi:DNA-binding beta-propeller fold protein YncE
MTIRGLVGLVLTATLAGAATAQSYKPAGVVPLGAPDRWDYVVHGGSSGRVYVAHGDRLSVVDGRAAKIIGEVTGIVGGTHGTAIAAGSGLGFTDDGKNGVAVAFDLATLKAVRRITAREDADAMIFDEASGHVFVIEGDPASITVLDPKADHAIATIEVGEKLEYAVADDRGALFVAGEANGDVVKIDTRINKVVAHWPAADCRSPHGLALDRAQGRLFLGCVNSEIIVLDATAGSVVTKLPIGRGSDAIAFDSKRRRVFSSNGADGTITVYQEQSGRYRALAPVVTKVSGRTMTVDPASGRLFVAAADVDPSPTPGGRPKPRPGTLQLLMFDPVD